MASIKKRKDKLKGEDEECSALCMWRGAGRLVQYLVEFHGTERRLPGRVQRRQPRRGRNLKGAASYDDGKKKDDCHVGNDNGGENRRGEGAEAMQRRLLPARRSAEGGGRRCGIAKEGGRASAPSPFVHPTCDILLLEIFVRFARVLDAC